MCRTSAAMGYSANGPSPGPQARASPSSPRLLTPPQPHGVNVIELLEGMFGPARVLVRLIVNRRPAKVAGDAGSEYADDKMREPPSDRRHRRWGWLGVGIVDDEFAATSRDSGPALPPGVDIPAIGHRLPEVLGVGQPFVAIPKVFTPMPVKLFGQLVCPVDAHDLSVAPSAASSC
jgi:hypothetical protein